LKVERQYAEFVALDEMYSLLVGNLIVLCCNYAPYHMCSFDYNLKALVFIESIVLTYR